MSLDTGGSTIRCGLGFFVSEFTIFVTGGRVYRSCGRKTKKKWKLKINEMESQTASAPTSRRSSALFVLYGRTSISDRMCLARSKSPAAKLRLYSSRVTISNKSSISPRVKRGSEGSFDRIRCTSLMVSVTSIIACLACSFFRSAIVRGDTYEYNSFESGKTGGGRCMCGIGGGGCRCVIGGAARPATPIHCRCTTSDTNHVTCFRVGHIFGAENLGDFDALCYVPFVRRLVRFAHNSPFTICEEWKRNSA